MGLKLLVALLVLSVVLFAVGMGLSIDRPSATADDLPSWIESLADRFVPKRALAANDISVSIPETCLQLLTESRLDVPANSSWVLLIKESRTPVRTLSLAGDATVILDLNTENRPTVTLSPGDEWPALQVFQEGGELRIECGIAPCQVWRTR